MAFKDVGLGLISVMLMVCLPGHGEVSSATSTPEGVVNRFLELELAGERARAWELLVPEDQRAISQEDFSALCADRSTPDNLAMMRSQTNWQVIVIDSADDDALLHVLITYPAMEQVLADEDFTADVGRIVNEGIDFQTAIIKAIRQQMSRPGGLPTHTETLEYSVRRVEGQWRINDGWATGVEVRLQLRPAAEVE